MLEPRETGTPAAVRALRRPLQHPQRASITLPECRAGGGVLPGVDLNDSASLLKRMERLD